MKPRSLVRGTRDEAKDAAGWIAVCAAGYAPRIASAWERDLYLGRPSYLSLAVVTCSPNRSKTEPPYPVLEGETM
ncbi:hypothetical protein GCM10010300_06430 [Streptomyces olivaceoviridis]|nr:hypothetical protein GCM10010300_06430 [Streptomyces olivaceoviridis]